MVELIPIIIPAYEPDDRLIVLLRNLTIQKMGPIILVDDGSGDEYHNIFDISEEIIKQNDGVLLTHDVNLGKGKALKTAFSYILNNYPNAVGCVTADSDGQHTDKCISSVIQVLQNSRNSLVLGVRNFDGEDIPWKSEFGNKLTMKALGYIADIHVSDTQTGLRGIPRSFMNELLTVPGDRFEFEMQMLLESVGRYPIIEVPIKTIYDSKENHQTHFNPIVDSIKIYRILGKKFFKYIFSSFSSSLIDLVLFSVFCIFLKNRSEAYVAISTVLARIISATYNYIINYKVVFKSKENVGKAAIKYAALAIIQMSLSALLVTGGVTLLIVVPEVIVKIIVDTILFFISYSIQQKYVFQRKKSTRSQLQK